MIGAFLELTFSDLKGHSLHLGTEGWPHFSSVRLTGPRYLSIISISSVLWIASCVVGLVLTNLVS